MLGLKKIIRGKKEGQRTEKQSTQSSASLSPAPSTILPSPTPPVVSLPVNEENEESLSLVRQPDAVEPANSKLATTPVEEKPVGGKKSRKKDVEHNTKKQDRMLKILDPIIDLANIGKNASEVAQDASGPLKAAFGVTERVLTIVRAAVANDKAWEEFMGTLEDHKGVLDQNRKLVEKNRRYSQLTPVDSELVKALEDYETALDGIRKRAEQSAGRFKKKDAKSYFMQPLTSRTQSETIVRLRNDLRRSWDFLQGRINLSVRSTTMRVEEHVARMRISQTLQVAEARGDSVGKLLPGTRMDIIQKISTWADDLSSGKQIFWLCDGPGTGKSTIAAHMANEWKGKGRLAGSFFFSREDEHTHDLSRFCATIAKQTIELHPRGERYIIDLPKDPSFLPFFEKFDVLIKGLIEHIAKDADTAAVPASDQVASTSHPMMPLVIVIDSLDQCDTGNHVELSDQARLLDALLHHLPSITSAKVLLTSTPLPGIQNRFQESESVVKSELSSYHSASSRMDIELYVRDRLGRVLTTYQQDQVIASSNGVFQVASVSCRFLEKAIHPTSALSRIVSMKLDTTFSNMYATLFENIKEELWDIEESINAVRTVLQAVVLAHCPVTIATHHEFFPKMDDGLISNYVQEIISRLRGIVKVGGDEVVYILHPTFRVYLLSLSPGETFNIAAPAGHAFMASRCFKLLEKLEYDLSGVAHNRETPLPMSNALNIPSQVLQRFGMDNSTPLRYAVVFWARHAAEGLVDEDMRAELVSFFQSQLLKWIEWAATIRELPDCIIGLEELAKHLEPRVHLYANVLEISALKWCEEALRFLKCQKSIIDQSPMQVYYSALAFDDYGSLVQSHYKSSSPHALPNVVGHSDDAVHAGGVSAVAISRSGDLIATAGNDLVIRLWDGGRRQIMGTFVNGHTGAITSIAFSSDGSLLASGSMDGTISIWTVREERGSNLLAALAGNGSEIECLEISDDNRSIICACRGETIDVWSIPEKKCLCSYVIPALSSITDEEVPGGSPETTTSFIACSKDLRTIALSCGSQLRVFQADDQVLSEFLTIRYGRPAQPMFSWVLSTSAINSCPTGSYLYWGEWVLDLGDYQRDVHRFISKASDLEANYSLDLDFAGPVTRPASLLYAAQQPTRINSYRMDEDAGVLLLPQDMNVDCWASIRTKIVVGTGDGRVVLVEFAHWNILGKEGEGFVAEEPNSDDGYDTASDGPGEGEGNEALTEDFMSAIEGPISRQGSAAV